MAAAIDNSLLEAAKIHEERNVYPQLREYCQQLQHIKSDVEIVASGYALETNNYVFVVYSKKNWERVFCEPFAMDVRNRYSQIVSTNWGQECDWFKTIVIPDSIFAYRFLIPHVT